MVRKALANRMQQDTMLQSILGQPNAVETLERAMRDERLAGSYLFVGPEGVGKAYTALRFAALLCGANSDDDSRAKRIFEGSHPDVRMIQPTGKSNTIHVGQLWPRSESREFPSDRAMLRDLHFEPIAGPKRIFIINGAEGLRGGNDASGNSILKSLEEPPHYAHFILTASSGAGLLPTIVSRCQVVRFNPVPIEHIENILMSKFGVESQQAHFLSAYSEGRIGYAVALSRSPGLLAGREELLNLAYTLGRAPMIQSFKLAEQFKKLSAQLIAVDDFETEADDKEKNAREPILRGLDMLAIYFRDLMAVRVMGSADALVVNKDRLDQISKSAGLYSTGSLNRALRLIPEVRQAVDRNANTQLALEVLFAELATLRN
jgi:DNA polymerase-3 subunit delta'